MTKSFIAGTILRQKFHSFEQMLWRVCRGNIFLRQVDIDERLEDPKTGEMQAKCIFIIVFQGDQLKNKCKKICEGSVCVISKLHFGSYNVYTRNYDIFKINIRDPILTDTTRHYTPVRKCRARGQRCCGGSTTDSRSYRS
jgi:hypothetical protein